MRVVSRYAADESQRKALEEFEKKRRENIQGEAKKRRLLDKQVQNGFFAYFCKNKVRMEENNGKI